MVGPERDVQRRVRRLAARDDRGGRAVQLGGARRGVAHGGGARLGASAMWTGLELQGKPQGMSMSAQQGGMAHETKAANIVATDDWAARPTLDTAVYRDPGAGWNLNVITTNFTFDAKSAGLENVEGHGHAHVYVNGAKLGRVYGAWHHIGALPLGENEVTVSLYANDHSVLASDGVKITSTSTVIVEQ